jgi:hypothetical protein
VGYPLARCLRKKARPEDFINLQNSLRRGYPGIGGKIKFTHSQNRSQKRFSRNARVDLSKKTFFNSPFDETFQVICEARPPFFNRPPASRKQHDITQPGRRDLQGRVDAG